MTNPGEKFSRDIEALRLMRWEPKFNGTLTSKTDPNAKTDMWLLVDDDSGGVIVSLGVPAGRSDIAGYVAACCGNPVRWVTSMWKPDPIKAGIAPEAQDVLGAQADGMARAMFDAAMKWHEQNVGPDKQINGWVMNDVLAQMWFAFCGQLSHDMRGRLLFRFLQLATTDYDETQRVGSPLHERTIGGDA